MIVSDSARVNAASPQTLKQRSYSALTPCPLNLNGPHLNLNCDSDHNAAVTSGANRMKKDCSFSKMQSAASRKYSVTTSAHTISPLSVTEVSF